ncbi:lipid A biosynthesis acyltransferase [Hyphomicrobium sp. LHD-15]|uniref:lysophospholipid acyltransferase family protein n=1 Tax=Hyphomicrobium sp. LHD-15 TaxID=3072142 RepID=UPI00280D5D7C|nr:lipid A biosynthesis acyltransferase [Hyphomicrobium sp. LHD-15]MDQ8699008.1 lipid A biosynthesis acyltransferase [Hyphomicrobium sp. LHD-15]
MPLKTLRHWVEYALSRLAIGVMRMAGIDASAHAFAWLGRKIGPRTRRHQQSLRNLAIAFPHKSATERARIALAMWDNMGRVAAELILLDRILADPARVAITGTEELETAVRNREPQVGVTLHAGNWELAIWPVKKLGGDPAGVYRPLSNPLIDRLVRTRRSALFSGGLFAKGPEEGPRAAKVMIDFVRNGGWLGFVADHVDRRGIPVDFLGQDIRVTHVPALIARHTNAQVWVARTIRIGTESRFRIDARKLDLPTSDDKREDACHATQMIFSQFEAWIREHPEQWQWWNIRVPREAPRVKAPEAATPDQARRTPQHMTA